MDIKGWEHKDWGRRIKVDRPLDQVSAAHYDALLLPGGQINPDLLRVNPRSSSSSEPSTTRAR